MALITADDHDTDAMKVVIAKPSPFARKVRVALREKALACDEIVENPWAARTAVPGRTRSERAPR